MAPRFFFCFAGWPAIAESFGEEDAPTPVAELPDGEALAEEATAGFFSFMR